MLKRRIIGTAALGASIALASVAFVHSRTGPSQSAQLTVTTPAGTPPPFPDSVVGGQVPPSGQTIKTGVPGRSGVCSQQSTHWTMGTDAVVYETSVAQLASDSDAVVVAQVTRQVAYWKKIEDTWQAWTMTEYHVTDVVRGTVGPWVQIADFGASSDLIPTCKNLAFTVANEPLPMANATYVLLLRSDPQTGKLTADTLRRFPVIKGVVYTEATLHSAAGASVIYGYRPEALDSFLAVLQATHNSP